MEKLSSSSVHTVLLSASPAGSAGDFVPALADFGSSSFIEWQVRRLSKLGFGPFLVEVETVPGRLADMAERMARENISVKFVRQAEELPRNVEGANGLLVIAAGFNPSDRLVCELAKESAGAIMMVDQDASEAFERVDLNYRWSGLAVIPQTTISMMGAVPEGYALPSTLLRHGLQAGLATLKLPRSGTEEGELRHLSSPADIQKLLELSLTDRAKAELPPAERALALPAARFLMQRGQAASAVWLPAASLGFALLSVLLVFTRSPLVGVFAAFLAILLVSVARLLSLEDTGKSDLRSIGCWLGLAATLTTLAWQGAGASSAGAAIGASIAMLTYVGQLRRHNLAFIFSPLLVCLLLAIAVAAGLVFAAVQIVLIGQVIMLVRDAQTDGKKAA